MNQVEKDKKKLLILKDMNPWRKLLPLRSLFVLGVLVDIMIDSHIFHVNKIINSTFRYPFDPQTHEPSGQKTRKND